MDSFLIYMQKATSNNPVMDNTITSGLRSSKRHVWCIVCPLAHQFYFSTFRKRTRTLGPKGVPLWEVPVYINILTINLKLWNNFILQKKIHVMLGLIPPEVTPEDEECNALLNETLYSDADNSKPSGK